MRSPPPPALHDVLVARPGTPSTAVIRRDDILAAAVLAAEDRTAAAPQRQRRSVLSRVQRKWAKFSDGLRRRSRASTAASNSAASAAAALAATEPKRTLENRNDLVAAFDRQRVKRLQEMADREGRIEEEMAVCSLREPGSRRVRQVGAREDDDTLLMLPRVASVSFSAAEDEPARVRQLPRVSGLMPVRAPRPSVSPVSSERSDGSGDGDDDAFSDRAEDDIEAEMAVGKRALHRLPTGMSKMDVEREMERAVVEIASEGEEDSGELRVGEEMRAGVETRAERKTRLPGEGRAAGNMMRDRVRDAVVTRSVSDVHRDVTRRMGEMKSAFARRASSTTQSRTLLAKDDGDDKLRGSKDPQLFEDDYLSFQGFHGHGGGYQSMGLLRSRRISSITDSMSEDEDEPAIKAVGHMDSRRRIMRRNGILPVWFKKAGAVGFEN